MKMNHPVGNVMEDGTFSQEIGYTALLLITGILLGVVVKAMFDVTTSSLIFIVIRWILATIDALLLLISGANIAFK